MITQGIQNTVIIRHLPRQAYSPCWQSMRQFTRTRDTNTPDEIWILEHEPVFTQGQNGQSEHILTHSHNIPIIQTDRGGQVTYHGPGQLIFYTLIDLKRKKLNVRQMVSILETAVIKTLSHYKIEAYAEKNAPGIYVNGHKICSLGLRVSRGCSYHGLALNIHMDLSPFDYINPCGFYNLKMTQLKDLSPESDIIQIQNQLLDQLIANLGYTHQEIKVELPNAK